MWCQSVCCPPSSRLELALALHLFPALLTTGLIHSIVQTIRTTTILAFTRFSRRVHAKAVALELVPIQPSAISKRASEFLEWVGKKTRQEELTEALYLIVRMFYTYARRPPAGTTPCDIVRAVRTFTAIQKQCRIEAPVNGQPVDLEKTLPLTQRFMQFAMGAYGHVVMKASGLAAWFGPVRTHEDAIAQLTGLSPQDILHSDWIGSIFSPVWYIARDPQTRSIVVTFRGTTSMTDVMTDLVCEATPFKFEALATDENPEGEGFAHIGFLKAAQKLDDKLAPIVAELLETHPDYGLILTGHSLGAAVAAMLTMLWAPRFPNIHCYAYAEPCVVSKELCPATQQYITAILHGDDVVPRFDVVSYQDLKSAIFRLASDKSLASTSESDPAQTMEILKKKETLARPRLYPAGTLIHILPAEGQGAGEPKQEPAQVLVQSELAAPNESGGGAQQRKAWLVEPESFDELVLSKTMFSAHLPHEYLNALQWDP